MLLGSKALLARKADNFTAVCEPIIKVISKILGALHNQVLVYFNQQTSTSFLQSDS
jgi:hypothetical protein